MSKIDDLLNQRNKLEKRKNESSSLEFQSEKVPDNYSELTYDEKTDNIVERLEIEDERKKENANSINNGSSSLKFQSEKVPDNYSELTYDEKTDDIVERLEIEDERKKENAKSINNDEIDQQIDKIDQELQDEKSRLQGENEALEKEIADLTAERDKLEDKKTEIMFQVFHKSDEEFVDNYDEKTSEIENKIIEINKKIDDLNGKLQLNKSDLEKINDFLSKHKDKVKDEDKQEAVVNDADNEHSQNDLSGQSDSQNIGTSSTHSVKSEQNDRAGSAHSNQPEHGTATVNIPKSNGDISIDDDDSDELFGNSSSGNSGKDLNDNNVTAQSKDDGQSEKTPDRMVSVAGPAKDSTENDGISIDNSENLPIPKTGLQIFREQFNKMPEIKNKHTLSKRLSIFGKSIGATGFLALGTAIFAGIPPVGIAGAIGMGVSTFGSAIVKRVTGEKKIEDEIYEQFMNMDPNEFKTMQDWLTEEQVQEIQPNEVILDAYARASEDRGAKEFEELNQENVQRRERIQELSQKHDRTPEENEELSKKLEEDRNVQQHTSNISAAQRRRSAARRAKELENAKYENKGKRFANLFAHRNTPSSIYKNEINNLADMEYRRDKARAECEKILSQGGGGSQEYAEKLDEEATFGKVYRSILDENTSITRFGRSKGIFLSQNQEIKVMNERPSMVDKTLAALITIGGGLGLNLANIKRLQDAANRINKYNVQEHNNMATKTNAQIENARSSAQAYEQASSKVTQDDIQKTADYVKTGERGNLESRAWHYTNPATGKDWVAMDQQAQNVGNVTITNGKKSDMIRQLAGAVSDRKGSDQALAESAKTLQQVGGSITKHGVDHTVGLNSQMNIVTQNEGTVRALNAAADTVEAADNMNAAIQQLQGVSTQEIQKVYANMELPISTAVAAYLARINEHREQVANQKSSKLKQVDEITHDDGTSR